MLKISFDFDCTLDEHHIQQLVSILIKGGADVYIITSRFDDRLRMPEIKLEYSQNRDVFRIAKELGIPLENIHFTEGDYKYQIVKKLNIDIHYDDQPYEIFLIQQNGSKGLLVDIEVDTIKYFIDSQFN